MKASELRIGSLLRDKVSKTELKVIELTEKDIITYVIDRSLFPLKNGWGIEPIQLTEEWLLNFGFEKELGWDNMVYFNNNGMHIYLCENGKESWLEYENDIVLKSVHQLQNLYFALTNEELIINK